MGFSSSERSASASPSRPRMEGGPFSGSGLGVGGGGGNDGDVMMGETVINGSYFGDGMPTSAKGVGGSGSGSAGGGGGHAPNSGQQRPQPHGAHHGPGVNGGRPGGGYLHGSAPPREAPAAAAAMVRGHRSRNTSASCGSYSAIANDGSLVVIGGVGTANSGFLDQTHPPPPPDLAGDFDPPPARLQRNLSLPGVLRDDAGGQGQGQGFVSTSPSAGLKGGGGYFSAVPNPGRGSGGTAEGEGGGIKAGDCTNQEACPADGVLQSVFVGGR